MRRVLQDGQTPRLQYQARQDGSRRDAVPGARRELFEAMLQVARGGQGPTDQIASVGCSIKWLHAG